MTTIDSKALEAAREAFDLADLGDIGGVEHGLKAAITAYLNALPSPKVEGEPVARKHEILEPDGHKMMMLSASDANPWSHWLAKHLDDCTYQFTPLYPSPILADGVIATHRHKKRGSEYMLIGIGKMQAENWQVPVLFTRLGLTDKVDMREVAIYRSVDDLSLWVRPREEFEDGRFEPLPTPPAVTP